MAISTRIIVTSIMVIVWLVLGFLLTQTSSTKGLIATVSICLLINGCLAAYYSYVTNRPASFQEWLKQ